jgi:hypothetical protein
MAESLGELRFISDGVNSYFLRMEDIINLEEFKQEDKIYTLIYLFDGRNFYLEISAEVLTSFFKEYTYG